MAVAGRVVQYLLVVLREKFQSVCLVERAMKAECKYFA
jgi:hypothetical protein